MNLKRTLDLLGSPPLVDDQSVVAGFELWESELFNMQALLECQLHTRHCSDARTSVVDKNGQ